MKMRPLALALALMLMAACSSGASQSAQANDRVERNAEIKWTGEMNRAQFADLMVQKMMGAQDARKFGQIGPGEGRLYYLNIYAIPIIDGQCDDSSKIKDRLFILLSALVDNMSSQISHSENICAMKTDIARIISGGRNKNISYWTIEIGVSNNIQSPYMAYENGSWNKNNISKTCVILNKPSDGIHITRMRVLIDTDVSLEGTLDTEAADCLARASLLAYRLEGGSDTTGPVLSPQFSSMDCTSNQGPAEGKLRCKFPLRDYPAVHWAFLLMTVIGNMNRTGNVEIDDRQSLRNFIMSRPEFDEVFQHQNIYRRQMHEYQREPQRFIQSESEYHEIDIMHP